jgi:hypothetical protein
MAILFLAVSVPGYARVEASAEWDKSADFRRLTTYAWLPEAPERMQDSRINYMLLEPRVKSSADIDLRLKGYQKVDGVVADFMVGYHVTKDEETSLDELNAFYGYAPAYGYWGRGRSGAGLPDNLVERFVRGTLILDIVDVASKKLIWRGYASAVIDPDAPLEDKTEIIQEATEKILENFFPCAQP